MRKVIIACVLFCFCAAAAVAQWTQFAPGHDIVAIDFWNARLGLAVDANNINIPLNRFTDTTFTPIGVRFIAQQIAIQDSDRAFATNGEGIFLGTNAWTAWDSIASVASPKFLGTTPVALFLSKNDTVFFLLNGDTLRMAAGLSPRDPILSIDYLNPAMVFAASAATLYRSTDSGAKWQAIRFQRAIDGIFADRAHGWLYLGGDSLRKSFDNGNTWTTLIPVPEFPLRTLYGTIFGAHDCSGTFYIYADPTDILRSRDGGLTFEDAGAQPPNVYYANTARTFDRGAVVYWIENYGYGTPGVWLNQDGIDGTIPDSVAPSISVSAELVEDTFCSMPEVRIMIHVSSAICTGITIDSVTVLTARGTIHAHVQLIELFGNDTTISLSYSGASAGLDSMTLRLWFHAADEGESEFRDFAAVVQCISTPAILCATDSLAYGNVTVGKSAQLPFRIADSGCAALRIDSLVSSNPNIFSISKLSFPLLISRDSSITIPIRFLPAASGEFLESLELGTSAGHLFIPLQGTGVAATNSVSVDTENKSVVTIFPNPAANSIVVQGISENSSYTIFDLLGRIVRRGFLNDGSINLASIPNGVYALQSQGRVVRLIIEGK